MFNPVANVNSKEFPLFLKSCLDVFDSKITGKKDSFLNQRKKVSFLNPKIWQTRISQKRRYFFAQTNNDSGINKKFKKTFHLFWTILFYFFLLTQDDSAKLDKASFFKKRYKNRIVSIVCVTRKCFLFEQTETEGGGRKSRIREVVHVN